jgi:ankyrin repeat protein
LEPLPTLAASYEYRRRFTSSIRIDVDEAGIARTDKTGWRCLRWADVRILTTARGQAVTLMDASRLQAIAIPRRTENLQALLNSIDERLADAYTARVRSGSRKPTQPVRYTQRRSLVLSLLVSTGAVAAICSWFKPYFYIEAMVSFISMLGYLATLPNSVLVGSDEVEMTTPVMSTAVAVRAIREVRLLVLPDRGPTIFVTLSGGSMVELRGFGDGAIFLYDLLRRVMDPGGSFEYIPARNRVSPRRACAFVTTSVVMVAVLIGLPIWNGRALSAGIRFFPPRLVGALLSIGASTEGRDEHGRTATYNAAKYGRVDSLRLMLARGGNPAARSHNNAGHTPLHVAAESNQLEAVRTLLAAGVDPNVRNHWGQTPLQQLVMLGERTPLEPHVVQTLLDAGADLNAQDMHGRTVFHASVEHPETADIVRALAAHTDAKLNLADSDAYTPFGLAIHKRSWPIAQVLAEAGARLDDDEFDNNTWLRKGVGRRDVELVRHMLDYGARVDIIAKDGIVPIQAAAHFGDASIVEMLIAAGADVNIQAPGHPSPLYLAIQQKHLEAARSLLNHGASPDFAVKEWTLLQRAAYRGDLDVVKLLIESGADLSRSTSSAPPPLLIAAGQGQVAVVQVLLNAGADVNTRFGRWTALAMASRRNQDTVRDLLIERGAQ